MFGHGASESDAISELKEKTKNFYHVGDIRIKKRLF